MIRAHSPFVLLAVAAAFGCASAPAAPASTPATTAAEPNAHVDGTTAKKLVHDGAHLIDVRTPEEYARGHIEGAENVPVDTVGDRDLGPKDTPLVLYCGTGRRAAKAAETLRAKGYTRVYELGAMSSWSE